MENLNFDCLDKLMQIINKIIEAVTKFINS